MKIYIYRIDFYPRIPLPVIAADSFQHDGGYYLITKENITFVDYMIYEQFEIKQIQVHISDPFYAKVSDEEYNILKSAHSIISRSFSYRFSIQEFEENQFLMLPCMMKGNKTTFDATFDWAIAFTNPPLLSDIYQMTLRMIDPNSNGVNIKKYIYDNREIIDKIMYFIYTLDMPISDYLVNAPVNNKNTYDAKLPVALAAAILFSVRIVERYCLATHREKKYQVVKRVAFSVYSNSIMEETTYAEYFKTKYGIESLDPFIPFIEVVPPKVQYEFIDQATSGLTKYPDAYNLYHSNLIEINRYKIKMIKALLLRLPDVLPTPKIETNLPIELLKFIPFPRASVLPLLQMNKIFEQLKSYQSGDIPLSQKVMNAAKHIQKETGYIFKDIRYLWSAITDPTFPYLQTICIPNYQRLEFLGDSVIDLLIGIALFNANPDAREGLMTSLKTLFVKNNTFAAISEEIGLTKLVLTIQPSNYQGLTKNSADLFEALFGAIYMDSDLATCFKVWCHLFRSYNDIIAKTIKHQMAPKTIEYIVCQKEPYFDITVPMLSKSQLQNLPSASAVGDAIGMHISNEELPAFVIAFTHSSVEPKLNYERFEYIGDILVKFAINQACYLCFAEANEKGMSIVANELKSNAVLGRAAVKMGLHNFIRCSESTADSMRIDVDLEDPNAPLNKIYGDLFESVTAAIWATKGLNAAVQFITRHIVKDKWSNSAYEPSLDPKSSAITSIQEIFKSIPVYSVWTASDRVLAAAALNGNRIPILGESSDRIAAERFLSLEIKEELDNGNLRDKLSSRLNEPGEPIKAMFWEK